MSNVHYFPTVILLPQGQKYNKPFHQRSPVTAKFSFEIKKALLLLNRGILFEKLRQDLKEQLKIEANHESIQTLVEAGDRKITTDKAIIAN